MISVLRLTEEGTTNSPENEEDGNNHEVWPDRLHCIDYVVERKTKDIPEESL